MTLFPHSHPSSGTSALRVALTVAILGSLPGAVLAQDGASGSRSSAYVDPSPHIERFVSVGSRARVEVLDWGGVGPAVLLIPGYGFSAHIYDDFALRLTSKYHVLAMTVRGWPPSDAPPTGYTYDTVAADIQAVIDSLALGSVVLVGHSFGGALITRAAIRYPNRVRALVYLDAALQSAPRDSVFKRNPVPRPAPPETADTTLRSQIAMWKQYATHYFYGDWSAAIEADLWARGTGISDAEWARRDSLVRRFGQEDPTDRDQIDFGRFSQPSLAVCALTTTRFQYPWLSPTSPQWREADAFTTKVLMPYQRGECALFQEHAQHGRTVLIESGHYLFINRPALTAAAVLTFLGQLH